MDKTKVIFGAGVTGQKAIAKYGKDNIAFFIDNDIKKDCTKLDGIDVFHFSSKQSELCKYHIIIACKAYEMMEEQLLETGITDYEVYCNEGYYDLPELVFNPYEVVKNEDNTWVKKEINRRVSNYDERTLFDHVEIETINRCNGVCSFCPVNRNVDSRPYKLMEIELFEKIINELANIDYSGKLALFSNNEPFLDDRIIELHKYARRMLPKARMHLCTNGTKLTLSLFTQIMEYLDELIVDNYNEDLQLISNSKKIVEYCELYPELKRRVTITLRKPQEVLTNRGGDAPNGIATDSEGDVSCLLPYKQLIIRPDGKVSLCCNDALGKCTLGDLNSESVLDVWYGEKFKTVREKLLFGRKNYARCKNCDTIFLC